MRFARHRGWRSAGAAALLTASIASSARAEESTAFLFPIEATFTRWSAPPLAVNGDDASRRIVGVPLRSASTLYGVGAAFGFLVRADLGEGRWVFGAYQDFFRASYAWTDTQGPTLQPVDGVMASVSRGNENLLELSAPVLAGAGAFLAYDRFLARVGFNWGWAYLWSSGSVAEPSVGARSGSADAGSAFFRLPLAVCILGRAFDGTGALAKGQDACVTFTPLVYEFGWLRGWSAGVRVDL